MEFADRIRNARESMLDLHRRMSRDLRLGARAAIAFFALFAAVWIALEHYPGRPPTAVYLGLRLAQILLLALVTLVCIRLDASARDMPRPPISEHSRFRQRLGELEDMVPGATLPILALLLPWVLSARGQSATISILSIMLASGTAISCARLAFVVSSFQRMIDACHAEGVSRAHAWSRFVPRKRIFAVLLVWTAGSAVLSTLSILDGGSLADVLNSFAFSSLFLASLIWVIVFVRAKRRLKRWTHD